MIQKWVKPMLLLLDNFKGKGRCFTIDSIYMGDIMAQIGCEEWKLNMVGTAQSNQQDADVKDVIDKMKARTYELCFWQNDTKNLVYPVWLDKAIVNMLSNHYGAISFNVENGMMW